MSEPAVMIENRARAVNIERRPEFTNDLRKIDIFAVKFAVVIAKGMHKFNSLTRKDSQTEIEKSDQRDAHTEAGYDESLPMFEHFSEHRMRGQINEASADMGHDQPEPE